MTKIPKLMFKISVRVCLSNCRGPTVAILNKMVSDLRKKRKFIIPKVKTDRFKNSFIISNSLKE